MSNESLAIILPPSPSVPRDRVIPILGGNGAPLLFSASLSSFIKGQDPSVEIMVLNGCIFDLNQIFSKLQEKHPTFVGISPSFSSYFNALKIARFAKNMGSQVIFGGHYATALSREILLNRGPYSNDYCVDAIVRQDGEEALWQIVSRKPFSQIPNLAYQTKDGIIFNEIKSVDLDKLPIPNFSLSQTKGDHDNSKFLLTFSRKGCLWHSKKGACLFCSLMHKDFRCKTASRFYQEIDTLIKEYQPKFIFDVGDNFLDDPVWFNEFHNLYKNYFPKPKLQCYSRIDSFTSDNIDKLLDISVSRIIFGLESNDDKILKTFGKGYSEKENRKAVELLNTSGIFSRINFVIGGINENRESLKRTFKFAEWAKKILKNRTVFFVNFLSPFPGSRAFDLLNRKTDEKYLNQDFFNLRQLEEDWFKYFCRVSFSEASKFIAEMDNLNQDYRCEKFEDCWR